MTSILHALDHALGAVLGWLAWLVVPVVVLLFLQWPLRDLIQAYSREANDLGQWIFALFMAAAVTAATRERIHLAADSFAQRYPPRVRAVLARLGALLGLVPWALFLLYASRQSVWMSLRQLESFPDTYNPGYFMIKLALWVLAGLLLLQALVDAFRPRPA
ncbi:MAG TPA: TRAP transporter small permease subunit [Casimicrobiaceae bacterium]|nr:TRAP transporter small permease subunit [Casimicrobiaceae bacterium]